MTPAIKITGTTGSGKSALAFAIKEALEPIGIHVVITGDEDESQQEMGATWKARLGCLSGQVVTIETKRVRAAGSTLLASTPTEEHVCRPAKVYRINPQIGRCRHSVSFHDGVKTHIDGSAFFALRTFRRKEAKDAFVEKLILEGYSAA